MRERERDEESWACVTHDVYQFMEPEPGKPWGPANGKCRWPSDVLTEPS